VFSKQAAGRVVTSILKVIALVLISWFVIRNRLAVILSLNQGSVTDAVSSGWGLCIRLLIFLAAALVLIGIIDYVLQWRRVESALRMTRQELKEEVKREEGDPLIRNRIRQIQRERARQRTLTAVPRATVVITNPTHLAIALKYERGSDRAPIVLAKGKGLLAAQIAQLARRHSIPVLERPPIARALYAAAKEGQEIPPELFRAVAEVIAFVFRLRGIAA
jgi:flagellar biosynthetic protein FlhB